MFTLTSKSIARAWQTILKQFCQNFEFGQKGLKYDFKTTFAESSERHIGGKHLKNDLKITFTKSSGTVASA